MSKPIVYVAHPYGGKEVNITAVSVIMRNLIKNRNCIYFSPLHNFSAIYYDGEEYAKGLQMCLDVLDHCDALVLCGDWQSSKGCIGEWAYARAKKIKIYTLEEYEALLSKGGTRKELIV